MGRPKKTENQKEADQRGAARMKKYESKQVDSTSSTPTTRFAQKYWEKVEPGPWEEKEYIFKT